MPKKTSICFACLCLFVLSGCATLNQNSPEQIAEPEVLAKFELTSGNKLLSLPVQFDGEQLFVLDTGSSKTIFDISLKDKLGKRILWPKKGKASHGKPITIEYFQAPHAHLGSLCLKKCNKIGVLDLAPVSSGAGQKVDGIIGMDFLKKYVVQIDFDNRTVSFIKSKKEGNIFSFLEPAKNSHPEWGQPIAIRYEFLSGLPLVKATIDNNISVEFMIDTGFSSFYECHLKSDILQKIRPNIQSIVNGSSHTAAGEVSFASKKMAVVDKFSIGPFEYSDSIFLESNSSMLGLVFLSRHLVTFDFPNRKMYLKEGDRFSKTGDFPISLSCGFDMIRDENNIIIGTVDSNSVAYTKGIRQKDIVIKINSQDVSLHSTRELYVYLTSLPKNSEKFAITLKRGYNTFEVVFDVEENEQ